MVRFGDCIKTHSTVNRKGRRKLNQPLLSNKQFVCQLLKQAILMGSGRVMADYRQKTRDKENRIVVRLTIGDGLIWIKPSEAGSYRNRQAPDFANFIRTTFLIKT
jgi:hypothetical protein